MENIIKILKKREKLIKKLIKIEDVEIERLKYKSRRIRLNNSSGKRRNWYVDRLQELQLCIELFQGDINSNEFIIINWMID